MEYRLSLALGVTWEGLIISLKEGIQNTTVLLKARFLWCKYRLALYNNIQTTLKISLIY